MLAEFTVAPISEGVSLSAHVARSMEIIEESGLPYRVNPMGTVVEGDFDQVWELIGRVHKAMTGHADRVLTSVKVDDRKGAAGCLDRKITSVEGKLGYELPK
jgi:uncharacterized protein (TIGR00106 family)